MEYKKTPPQRTPAEMEGTRIGHRFEKLVPDEDNFEIQVWENKDGKFLGYCLRTSLGKIVNEAWREAIAKHPGRYLAQTNGPYLVRDLVAPTGNQDEHGFIEGGDLQLSELAQWFGLVARCECGNINYVDRYDPRVKKHGALSLKRISEKLTCTACKKAGRPKSTIKLGLHKLPR